MPSAPLNAPAYPALFGKGMPSASARATSARAARMATHSALSPTIFLYASNALDVGDGTQVLLPTAADAPPGHPAARDRKLVELQAGGARAVNKVPPVFGPFVEEGRGVGRDGAVWHARSILREESAHDVGSPSSASSHTI